MNNRTLAKLTGWSLILMAVIAAFALGFAYPEFYSPEQGETLKLNLATDTGLYQGMLASILGIILLDVLVSVTLYKYFKNDHKRISWAAGALRLVYTLVFAVAFYFLTLNLSSAQMENGVLVDNFKAFQSTWDAGLIVFGGHLLFVGILMKRHKGLPNLLAYVTLLAGFSYTLVHTLKSLEVSPEVVGPLEMALALPMVVGELGLAIWLLVRGGKR